MPLFPFFEVLRNKRVHSGTLSLASNVTPLWYTN